MTIFKTVPFLHTAPEGNPALDVGIDLIDKLFTNVVQDLSAVMLAPTINTVDPVEFTVLPLPAKIALVVPEFIILLIPPPINEYSPDVVLPHPPPINEYEPLVVFLNPPLIVDLQELEILHCPPPMFDLNPLTVLKVPPAMEAY